MDTIAFIAGIGLATSPDATKELSIRIEFIIDALSERSGPMKQMVETVKIKVFEYGMLTPFWQRRLSRYEELGVVF